MPHTEGYETLLWVNGKPFGTFATKIVFTGHGNHYCDLLKMNVKAGEKVAKGAVVAVLEAMKMENEIMAPKDGTVTQVLVSKGSTVDTGAPLVVIG